MSELTPSSSATDATSTTAVSAVKAGFNADLAAILIALLLATLVRSGILPHIGW